VECDLNERGGLYAESGGVQREVAGKGLKGGRRRGACRWYLRRRNVLLCRA